MSALSPVHLALRTLVGVANMSLSAQKLTHAPLSGLDVDDASLYHNVLSSALMPPQVLAMWQFSRAVAKLSPNPENPDAF
jgi:hypothetical protein